VTLIDEDTGEKWKWQIVGEPEANASKGTISVVSPIARALIGKKKGATIEVMTPSGAKSYKSAPRRVALKNLIRANLRQCLKHLCGNIRPTLSVRQLFARQLALSHRNRQRGQVFRCCSLPLPDARYRGMKLECICAGREVPFYCPLHGWVENPSWPLLKRKCWRDPLLGYVALAMLLMSIIVAVDEMRRPQPSGDISAHAADGMVVRYTNGHH